MSFDAYKRPGNCQKDDDDMESQENNNIISLNQTSDHRKIKQHFVHTKAF